MFGFHAFRQTTRHKRGVINVLQRPKNCRRRQKKTIWYAFLDMTLAEYQPLINSLRDCHDLSAELRSYNLMSETAKRCIVKAPRKDFAQHFNTVPLVFHNHESAAKELQTWRQNDLAKNGNAKEIQGDPRCGQGVKKLRKILQMYRNDGTIWAYAVRRSNIKSLRKKVEAKKSWNHFLDMA